MILQTLALALTLVFPVSAVAGTTAHDEGPALTAEEVFRLVSPSVFVVEALDSEGTVIALGSGVAVAHDQVVTNQHVIDEAVKVRVRRGQQAWLAVVTHLAADHDLCRLSVSGLKAPGVEVAKSATLEVGEKVYALGTPKGLEMTFSGGLISALREISGGKIIQTTASISSGSSGGGLFDNRARLVGITTARLLEGQNLNFAVPGEWILALDQSPVVGATSSQGNELDYKAIHWFGRGDDHWLAGDHHQAIRAYLEALKLKPDFVGALINLGLVYWQLESYDKAIQFLRQALHFDSGNTTAWLDLGAVYLDLGQYDQAIQAYREILRINPDDHSAWFGLGLAYRKQGKNQKAIQYYREAIRHKPDDHKAWFNLGHAYFALRQYDQAIQAFREAARLEPDHVGAWEILGALLSIRGRNRSEVMEIYERLKILDPDTAEEFFNKFVLP